MPRVRTQTLRADAVICAMGGNAGPQFGTDGFGTRFAAQCGGKLEPLYPCLTALQTAKPNRSLAGIRAKAAATLLDLDRHCTVAVENGEVQFTDYGLSGICIMPAVRPSGPGGAKRPAVELDLFPMLDETALTALFAARVPLLPGKAPADFWTGLLNPKLGRALWAAAKLPEKPVDTLPDAAWQVLANAAKHWLFEGLTPCGWKQAQTTGGGLSLTEVTPSFQFKGCPGLYFVGETLDCAGSCGGFNLHWAFGSGIAAGRDAVHSLKRPAPKPNKKEAIKNDPLHPASDRQTAGTERVIFVSDTLVSPGPPPPESPTTPTRLGSIIRPLKVSESAQARSSFITAPTSTMAANTSLYPAAARSPSRYTTARVP